MKIAWQRLDKRLEEKIPELWKFLKWCMVGGFASGVELIVYYVLRFSVFNEIWLAALNVSGGLYTALSAIQLTEGRGALYTYFISITVGYAIAFVLNRKLAFKANNNVVFGITIYIINILVIIATGSLFGAWFNSFLYARELLWLTFAVKPLQMLIPMAWSYPVNRFIVFRQKKEEPDDTNNTKPDTAEDTAAG